MKKEKRIQIAIGMNEVVPKLVEKT